MPLPLPAWWGVGHHQMQQKRRSEKIGKRSYRLLMGPKSGLEMSGRLEVHRIPAGVQDRREHNKHLLLPVTSHVSEAFRKRRRRMKWARTGTRLELGSCTLRTSSRVKEESAWSVYRYVRTGYLLLLRSGIRYTIRMGPTQSNEAN